jgi:hypothetical protein
LGCSGPAPLQCPPPPSSKPLPFRPGRRRRGRVTTEGRAGPQPHEPRIQEGWSTPCRMVARGDMPAHGNPPSVEVRGSSSGESISAVSPRPMAETSPHWTLPQGSKTAKERQPTPTRPGGCRTGRPTFGAMPLVSFHPSLTASHPSSHHAHRLCVTIVHYHKSPPFTPRSMRRTCPLPPSSRITCSCSRSSPAHSARPTTERGPTGDQGPLPRAAPQWTGPPPLKIVGLGSCR